MQIRRPKHTIGRVKRETFHKTCPPNVVFKRGKRAIIGNVKTRVYSIRDIAGLWELPHLTAYNWYLRGVLPPPFFERPMGSRIAPYWIRGQVDAIVKSVNELWLQGCRGISSRRRRQVEELWASSERAKDRFFRKIERNQFGNISRLGVEWIDSPRPNEPNTTDQPILYEGEDKLSFLVP